MRLYEDIILECISRSGMITTDHPYDGSNFSLIFLVVRQELSDLLENPDISDRDKIDSFVSRFMTLMHRVIVQKMHYNWNY